MLLSPRGVTVRFAPRGLRSEARLATRTGKIGPPDEPWRGAIDAMTEAMQELPPRTRCRIITSSVFARYALVPFSPALARREANEALAAHVFRHVHAERAQSWRFRVAPAPAGFNRIACALDAALVDAIATTARSRRLMLAAVEPVLVAGFNAARARLPLSFRFAAVEPERLVLGLSVAGQWRRIVTERCSGDVNAALARLLAREALLSPAESSDDEPPPCWTASFEADADPAFPAIGPLVAAAMIASEKRAAS